MRTILWILTGFGLLYLIARFLQDAADLQAALETVNRQVETLETTIRELGDEPYSKRASSR